MKIGFVSPYFYPEMVGGIEWYLFHVTRLLQKSGHQVTVFATRSANTSAQSSVDGSQIEGVSVVRIPTLIDLTYRLKIWPRLAKHLKDTDLDVLHVFDYAQFHVLASILSSKGARWRSVVTVYDIHSQIPRGSVKGLPMAIFDRYFAGKVLSNFERILVRTPFQAEFVADLGLCREKVKLTPPGIDPIHFEDPPQEEVERARDLYTPSGEPMVLYVGRLHPIKGIDVLFRSVKILKGRGINVKVVVVGPDAHGYRSDLEDLARRLRIDDQVAFTGFVDEREKWILQSACDVAVLPSSFEGFGQSLAQAMARGKPVIGTDVGGIPWVLEDGRSGLLVRYGDEDALARAILRALTDEDLRGELSKNAARRARDFSYPKLVSDLEEIYSHIVDAA